jgi:hypothetical protein
MCYGTGAWVSLLVRVSAGTRLVEETFVTDGDKMVRVDALNILRHFLNPRCDCRARARRRG